MGRKASYEGGKLMTGLQRICFWLSVIDILFFFSTVIGCVIVENVVSDKRPVKFELSENGVTVIEPVQLPYGKDDLMAIWDYLATEHYTSAWVYNAVYFLALTILVSYLILEIWLCCALIRGTTERSLGHCKRWFCWRSAVVVATALVAITDLYQMQVTYSLIIWTPLTLFRVLTLGLVRNFIRQLKDETRLLEKVTPVY